MNTRVAALAVAACAHISAEAHANLEQPAAPASTPAPAPTTAEPAPAASIAWPPFRPLRYDEDYRFLAAAPRPDNLVDRLKYIPLSDDGHTSLSLGGEARTRYEYSSDPAFGLRGPGHDDFLLQRLFLHTDFRFGDPEALHARAFVQLLSGYITGEDFPKSGTQDNLLDLQQGFAEVIVGDNRAPAVKAGRSSFALRAGRQEMIFGSARLVTTRDPTNTRLAFDGVRATLTIERLTFDAFLVRPNDPKVGLFNDTQDDNTTFWGLYSAIPLEPDRRLGLDAYYFGFSRDNARFQSGVGDELRHSLGVRLWGKDGPWDHDTEAVFQFGTFDRPTQSEDILAWTVASNTGYTFQSAPWTPRIGLKLNYASGDGDTADDRLGTFNPLFPRNNYFSDANLLAPFNFFDIHPSVSVRPHEFLTLTTAFDAFFRASTDDAVFSPGGLVIPGSASDDRYVGSTLTFTADWAISRRITLSGSYAHFFKGDVVKDAGGKDVDFFAVWLTAKF